MTKRESNLVLVIVLLYLRPSSWFEAFTTLMFLLMTRMVWRLLCEARAGVSELSLLYEEEQA